MAGFTQEDADVMGAIYRLCKASGESDQENLRELWQKLWHGFGLEPDDMAPGARFFLFSDSLLEELGKEVDDESLDWLRQELDQLGDYTITMSDSTGTMLETIPFMRDTIGYSDGRGRHILAMLYCPEMVGAAVKMMESAQIIEAAIASGAAR